MPAPLPRRLVEVIAVAAVGSRHRHGSGCIVNGRTVLTAAHVVADAVEVLVRSSTKHRWPATLDPRFVGELSGPRPDLALVEIEDPSFEPLPRCRSHESIAAVRK
ncbi:trypsin-like peptidase domain-containing protein [Phytohabitans houttuyneae]|uniref:Peptidase S1 domain-containing protein n=1 Tax=Phytohabitans houttuyneae TaxID=1076126 RepID=A0A6V8K501_9ACTN|nr:hypothetical protein Phou_015780 [Phytohabitans houttuyneae]